MIAPSGASTGPLGARGCDGPLVGPCQNAENPMRPDPGSHRFYWHQGDVGVQRVTSREGPASDGNCGREQGRVVFPWCVSRETHHGKSDMRHPEDSMNDAGSSPTGSIAGGPRGSGCAPIVRMQWAGIQRGTASCTPGKRGHLEVSGRSSAPVSASPYSGGPCGCWFLSSAWIRAVRFT